MPAQPLDPDSAPPSGTDAEQFQWYLQRSHRSAAAEYMLGKMCSDGCGTTPDPLAAYTWLLRSERGATDLISKCRAIRELLDNNLTPQQRKRAETRAARPWPRQLSTRSSRAMPEPEPRVRLAPLSKQNF